METTALRKTVGHKLIDLGKNQKWLIEEIRERTGMYCDSSLLKKIFDGNVNSERITNAICEILGI